MKVPEDIDPNEKRDIKVIERMSWYEYKGSVELCKYRFLSSYTVYTDEKKVFEGWIGGYDPAKVYCAALSRTLKQARVLT